jgi:hypothetical protein
VGVPGENKRVKLIGYRDGEYVRGTSASSGTFEYAVSTVSGYQSFWMSPRDRGICAITHVQGKFDQFTHYVDYSAKDTQWYGTIQSSHAANAKFRCMAFDQR